MGMSYTEFWHGDPMLVKYYRDAYIHQKRTMNENAWLQGAYIYNAFNAALDNVMYSISRKGAKPKGYLREPLQLGAATESERKERERAERQKAIISLTNWKKAWDKKYGNS